MQTLLLALFSGAIAYAVAFIVLNRWFKHSVLYQIGQYWVFTLVWLIFSLQMRNAFFTDSSVFYVGILVLNVVVSVVAFMQAARKVSIPLRRLVDIVMQLSKGDLSKPNTEGLSLREGRDLGDLLASTLRMRETFSGMVASMSEQMHTLEAISARLASLGEEVSVRGSEQAASTEEISASMEELDGGLQQNVSHSEEAARVIVSVSEQSDAVRHQAEESE